MNVDNILDDYVKMKLSKPNQSKYVIVTNVWHILLSTFCVWSPRAGPGT